jgi:adenylosuccinate lyase
VHEIVRQHSHAVTDRIKQGVGHASELFERLKAEPSFEKLDFGSIADPRHFVGRAPEQVAEYLESEVNPIRQRYASRLEKTAVLSV